MTSSSRAPSPSFVTLPTEPSLVERTILDFLVERFPKIERSVWVARLAAGEVLLEDGTPVDSTTPYAPGERVRYFRSVVREPPVPEHEHIIHRDDHVVVADKPHFLPVTPSGPWVNQCVMYRLRERLSLHQLQVIHRLDRETAGLVLCGIHAQERGDYCRLFEERRVTKIYECLASVDQRPKTSWWQVENRIETGEPWFRMQIGRGQPNARTLIELREWHRGIGRFRLVPLTGKKHQLRLHMASLGFPIVNDRTYPELSPQAPTDFSQPLQLIARELAFRDPMSGLRMRWKSRRRLLWPDRG